MTRKFWAAPGKPVKLTIPPIPVSLLVLTPMVDGKSFEVKNPKRLESEILPRYYRHGHFTSFVRQLNFYNFKVRYALGTDRDAEDEAGCKSRGRVFPRGVLRLGSQTLPFLDAHAVVVWMCYPPCLPSLLSPFHFLTFLVFPLLPPHIHNPPPSLLTESFQRKEHLDLPARMLPARPPPALRHAQKENEQCPPPPPPLQHPAYHGGGEGGGRKWRRRGRAGDAWERACDEDGVGEDDVQGSRAPWREGPFWGKEEQALP